jgi:UDP-N-acetylmuramoyl-tripeptide--D-alanyl-D-alanine ligase
MRASFADGAGDEFFDKEITGFSIDSRAVATGELFFALSPADYAGKSFSATHFTDAHSFIPQAFASGAASVVARRERVAADEALQPYASRLLLVDDGIEALQMLARGVVESWGRKVVGITGSAGKTTAKDLTAHLLSHAGHRVLRTKKNFNNELGVPLSILQMETAGARPANFDVAVLEMGMSVPGEIARLCKIASPDISVVLIVAPVHLEFMGSIEAIARGKAQLVEGLKPGGIAVLNADDEYVAAMRDKHTTGQTLTFGIAGEADVSASRIESTTLGLTRFRLRTPHGEADAELPLPGRHNLMNALAASAVAACFEMKPEEIAAALKTAAPSEMRGEVLRFAAGFTVVDDSYNSNPRSLLSMAQSVAESGGTEALTEDRRRIVLAGEMLELGAEGARMHREAGQEIAGMGVDVLWGVRGLARELVEGARAAGMSAEATQFFETSEDAARALVTEVREGDLLLVKGSRGVHMEKVVEQLRETYTLKD